MKTTILILSVVLSLITSTAAAPLGTDFTYQGRLDDGGSAANGLYDFNFRLYDAETGGAALGPAGGMSTNAVTVAGGVFTVYLDFGDVFTGTARWLEVSVNTNLVAPLNPLMPRQMVHPAPYALYAAEAGGVSPSAVTSAALANDAVTGAKIANGNVVRSVNGLHDALTIAAGPNITVGTVGNTLTISSSGGPGAAWLLNGNLAAATNFLGTINDQVLTMKANNTTGFRLIPSPAGAPSIVGGDAANILVSGAGGSVIAGGGSAERPNQMSGGYYSFIGSGEGNFLRDQHNTLVGGYSNTIGRTFTDPVSSSELNFIGGGQYNTIETEFSSIVGGSTNYIEGRLGFIGGGNFNTVLGDSGVIVGGWRNNVGSFAAIVGGDHNRAVGHSAVVGGVANVVDATHSFIGGGFTNSIEFNSFDSVIGGGRANTIFGGWAGVIGGGEANTAAANYASVGGGFGNVATGQDAVVAGGSANAATAGQSTVGGGMKNRTAGAASTVTGGLQNTNLSTYGTIGGGAHNFASAPSSTTIAGGFQNTVLGEDGTISGGSHNIVQADAALIAGGQNNYVGTNIVNAGEFGFGTNYAGYSVILGGQQNRVSSIYSTVGGGILNHLFGDYGTIAGGYQNRIGTATDFYSSGKSDGAIGGGSNNQVQNSGGVVAGGAVNVVSGAYASILGGHDNSAAAPGSSVIGGEQNMVGDSHTNSVVAGKGAVSRLPHSDTHGRIFAMPGDGQTAAYVLTTTSLGALQPTVRGPAVPVSGAMAFRARIVAKAFGNASAAFEARGLIRNYGGQVLFVGTPTVELLGRDNAALNVTVEVSSGTVGFHLFGIDNVNVRWVCHLETSEVVF